MTLEIFDLSVKYGEKKALTEIYLNVNPGEILAIIGPNGAGKSTLIRAISGVLPISSGSIYFRGQKINSLSCAARAKILAVVPQAKQLGGAFTVKQTVMLGRTAYMDWLGREKPEDEAVVHWALKQIALENLENRRNAELSGGEQQRVLLARALAQQTPVLLMDEPTNHLDLHHQVNFLNLVRDLARDQGLAVMMAMHDLNQVTVYADRVALFSQGKILAIGNPEDVMTVDNINSAYEIRVEIINHPRYGTPVIMPLRGSSTT